MSAFRFAGCRHPLPESEQGRWRRDGEWLHCPPCGELRQVREVESVRDLVPRSGATPDRTPPAELDLAELPRRIANAAGKGQVALLVVDAAGVVVVGLKATGGLTELRHVPQDGLWRFSGALSGKPEVLDGSYALRNALGTDHLPERWEAENQGYPDQATRERQARELEASQESNVVRLPELPEPEPDWQQQCARVGCGHRLAMHRDQGGACLDALHMADDGLAPCECVAFT
jgi:hypothetical protein